MKQDLSEEGDAEENQDGTVQSLGAIGSLVVEPAIRRGCSGFGMSRVIRETLITDRVHRKKSDKPVSMSTLVAQGLSGIT